MRKIFLTAAALAFSFAATAAFAADDKAAQWCTDDHMKKMDDSVGKMTDDAKKKEASEHLMKSKDAMKAKDMTGCVTHMEAAHKSMGL